MGDCYRERDDESGPLRGIVVLDLTHARAGPTCVRQLADMGAEVVQIAHPGRGDLPGSDGYNLHRNKRSILLDLKSEAGLGVFYRLADRADIVVENFRAEVKRRLRIDYETLSKRSPRLIYASISGFGQQGPYATRPGLDQIAQGMGGLMSVTGPPGTGPWRTGIAISDTAAGTFLTQGVLAALWARERTGRGQWVHTSLLEAMVNFMDFQAARWLVDGDVPGQAGNDHPTLFPMGTFEASDGKINIAAVMDWQRFLELIDGTELAEDARFSSWQARNTHREALHVAVDERLRRRPSAEWIELFNAAGIPCGPILALDEVFADPQVKHLRMTRSVEHAAAGSMELLRFPVTFSDTPASVRTAAPMSGAHTREILRECGFGESEIERLLSSGSVALERQPR